MLSGMAWPWTTAERVTRAELLSLDAGARRGVKSPAAGDLRALVWSDIWGTDIGFLTRERAMTLPGVQRGRGILFSLIADKPLQAYRGSALVDDQPTFLYRTDGPSGPWQRMKWTLDDLIFYGASLWQVERSTAQADGHRPIRAAWRYPIDMWDLDAVGRVQLFDVDGNARIAHADEVIIFEGPAGGLLTEGARTLSGVADLESAWLSRAKSPVPLIDLHETEETDLSVEERRELVQAWNAARRNPDGATASTPYNVEARAIGDGGDASLFIEARNAGRLDVAAFFNMPGAILDATTSTASLTYVTQEGTRTSIYDLTLPYWIRPIEDRLSQDDVVPRGQSVKFDFSSLVAGAPVPVLNTPD